MRVIVVVAARIQGDDADDTRRKGSGKRREVGWNWMEKHMCGVSEGVGCCRIAIRELDAEGIAQSCAVWRDQREGSGRGASDGVVVPEKEVYLVPAKD